MSQRTLTLCVIAIVVICVIVTWLWDFAYHINLPFLSNVVVGVLTVIGALLGAYLIYERKRMEREREIIRREKELKQRATSTLDSFKKDLLTWLFHFAHTLSGYFSLYKEGRIYSGKYKDDVPRLEDIFGIGSFDPKGNRLRGTDEASSINEIVCTRKLSPSDLYHSLNYGRGAIRRIEKEMKRFPQLIENVSSEVAEIVNLRDSIESRFDEVRRWEIEHEKERVYIIDESHENLDIRSNLRSLGEVALNIVIAIDNDIKRLNSEIRN